MAKYMPDGYHTVTPYLTVRGAAQAMEFYKRALGAQAVDAGCKATRPPADMFWGDRYGQVEDPFGNQWGLATHTEDLAPDEIARRARAAFAQTESGKT
jgi:uncharacterized glyoxalase superfamily protein PhnB